jgi:3-oxoacyl-[acyl-carrier-protein] synthase-3
MLVSGAATNALVIGAEIMSRHVDPNDRNTAALFGDGAGAIVATAGAPGDIGPVVLGSDGAHAQLIVADRETQLLAMDGHETFKQAVRRMTEASIAACEAAGVALADLDLYVYHQANTRILASLAERLSLDPAKVVDSIASLGNTSAASVPLALADARAQGRLAPGMRVLLAAAGSGFTWGATVAQWGLAA